MSKPTDQNRGLPAQSKPSEVITTEPSDWDDRHAMFLEWVKVRGIKPDLPNGGYSLNLFLQMDKDHQFMRTYKGRQNQDRIANQKKTLEIFRVSARKVLENETKEYMLQKFIEIQKRERPKLRHSIDKAWNNRIIVKGGTNYKFDLNIPLQILLRRINFASYEDRWLFMRNYYINKIPTILPEEKLLDLVVKEEEMYLKFKYLNSRVIYPFNVLWSLNAQDRILAAINPMLGGVLLRGVADRGTHPPDSGFEPGIADYDLGGASLNKLWVDNEIKFMEGLGTSKKFVKITYLDGKELEIPLNLIEESKVLKPEQVRMVFVRRHKETGRLIPFVIYNQNSKPSHAPSVQYKGPLEALSENDLGILGWPSFDKFLTPNILNYFSLENKWRVITQTWFTLTELYTLRLGLKGLIWPIGAIGSFALRTSMNIFKSGVSIGRSAYTNIQVAIARYGISTNAIANLIINAQGFYVRNAIRINTAVLDITEITAELKGIGSTGIMLSQGDYLEWAVKGAKTDWQVLRAQVVSFDKAKEEAKLIVRESRIAHLEEIEKTFKSGRFIHHISPHSPATAPKSPDLLHKESGSSVVKKAEGLEVGKEELKNQHGTDTAVTTTENKRISDKRTGSPINPGAQTDKGAVTDIDPKTIKRLPYRGEVFETGNLLEERLLDDPNSTFIRDLEAMLKIKLEGESFVYKGGKRGSLYQFYKGLKDYRMNKGAEFPSRFNPKVLSEELRKFIESDDELHQAWKALNLDSLSITTAQELDRLRKLQGNYTKNSREFDELYFRIKKLEEIMENITDINKWAEGKVGKKRPDFVKIVPDLKLIFVVDVTQKPIDEFHNFKTLLYAKVIEKLMGGKWKVIAVDANENAYKIVTS